MPWRTSDDDPNADGEAMEGKVIDLRDGEAFKEDEQEEVKELLKLNLPRSFRTKDQDYQQPYKLEDARAARPCWGAHRGRNTGSRAGRG